MGKVARQVVERAGINVDELIQKLVAAAGAEFTTFYYYTILRAHAIGFEGEGLKEIIEDARIEDRNHFEALVPRIYELGGDLPRDIRAFADQAGCPDAYLPDSLARGGPTVAQLPGGKPTAFGQYPQLTGNAMQDLLTVLVEAERCAMFETADFDAAVAAVRRFCDVAACTRSEKGSVVVAGEHTHVIAAAEVGRVVDTTGAGDLYASGFLFGLTRGRDLATCGRLGSLCAAEIISHVGARPEVGLATLAKEKGLI